MASVMKTAYGAGIPLDFIHGRPSPWVQLLPNSGIRANDGQQLTVGSMSALAESFRSGDKLPIDEAYATDRGVLFGYAAPSRGWIVSLDSRADGLWGNVEWTPTGTELVADQAYAYISPTLLCAQSEIVGVRRASLVNMRFLPSAQAEGLSQHSAYASELDADERRIAALMGIDEASYRATKMRLLN